MITQEDIDAMEDKRSLIEQAVLEWFGERCPDFEPECVCCQVWREIDRIEQLERELAAEKALADRLAHELDETWPYAKDPDCLNAYRKARGL